MQNLITCSLHFKVDGGDVQQQRISQVSAVRLRACTTGVRLSAPAIAPSREAHNFQREFCLMYQPNRSCRCMRTHVLISPSRCLRVPYTYCDPTTIQYTDRQTAAVSVWQTRQVQVHRLLTAIFQTSRSLFIRFALLM